jgi:hypothetical protein
MSEQHREEAEMSGSPNRVQPSAYQPASYGKPLMRKMNRAVWAGLVSLILSGWAGAGEPGAAKVDTLARHEALAEVKPPLLTEAGQALEAGYAARIHTLKTEIKQALPVIDQQKRAAYFEARMAEKSAEAAFKAMQDQLGKVGGAQALVDHAKGKWIGGAETGIAAAEAALKKATTEAEREAAQRDLANCQKNKEDGLKALKEREEALAAAKREEPKWIQARDAAQKGAGGSESQ